MRNGVTEVISQRLGREDEALEDALAG